MAWGRTSIYKDYSFIIAAALCILIAAGVAVTYSDVRSKQAVFDEQAQRSLNKIDEAMRLALNNATIVLRSVEKGVQQTDFSVEKIHHVLKAYRNVNLGLGWNRADGMFVAGSETGITAAPIDVSDRAYIKESRMRPGEVMVFSPMVSGSKMQLALPVVVGVTDKTGRYRGTVSALIWADPLRSIIESMMRFDSVHYAIMTRDGKVLLGDEMPADAENVRSIRLKEYPLDVHVWSNKLVTFEEMKMLLLPRLVFGGVLVAILLLVGVVFHRRIIQPMHELRRMAEGIVDGRYMDVAISGAPEVARLGEQLGRVSAKFQETEEENKAKAEFIAHMSHELRTPLNAIIGFSEMLQSGAFGDMNAKQHEYMTDIRRSGEHLLNMVNDILDVSKIDAGKITLHPEKTDMNALLRDCVRDVYPMARKAGVELEVALGHGLPPMNLDPKRFRQVVLNLLSNSIKYTDMGGEVVLSGWVDDEGVKVQIADNGIGMTARELKKAMHKFGRVEHVHSRDHDGAGLGLPLSKKLTMLMGGWFDIQSAKSVGTTVTLRFSTDLAGGAAPQMPALVEKKADAREQARTA